jgi:isopentenyl diphosphate isomerase/L-lactate dehydrogenase-like FMN-dependent dehydrogenase
MSQQTARRDFLKFLAASPYVASLGGAAAFLRQGTLAQTAQEKASLIGTPAEALDVFDFEEVAHRNVAPGHWAFMRSGVDDDATIAANREGFQHIMLRPRRLHDATKVDMRVNLFGTTYNSPIFTCPTGGQKSFHPDGELAVARADKAYGTLQYLSTATSTSVEEVNAALGRPVWYQVYAPRTWEACQKLLTRVAAARCTVIALTVDTSPGGHAETYLRTRPKDLRQCAACHDVKGEDILVRNRPMREGLDAAGGVPQPLDWAYVDKMRKFWKGKFVIKGLTTGEDARLAVEHGIDGIHVSDHGGRVTETLQATIEALPEVVAAVNGRVPVVVDSGFRRGTDVFKALALGASAVGIGRPMLWGLGAFGQPGVERVLEIMQGELKLVMGNCGTRTVADITRAYVELPDRKN